MGFGSFAGKTAVVTGGGSGIGRSLGVQLTAEGCSIAVCDVNLDDLAETRALAEAGAPADTRVSTHICDVSDESQVVRFRNEVIGAHGETIELLINNAGIAGGNSFVTDTREDWERTFAVNFWGVYYCSRAFLPHLIAADAARIVNVSSINAVWASGGWGTPSTAYGASKFAVKGLSEALIDDFRANAPHVEVSVVMPGRVRTGILTNSRRYFGVAGPESLSDNELLQARVGLAKIGLAVPEDASPDEIRGILQRVEDWVRDSPSLGVDEAVTIMLDGIRAGRWRIVVGDDARELDEAVRADPDAAYDHEGVGIVARPPQSLLYP